MNNSKPPTISPELHEVFDKKFVSLNTMIASEVKRLVNGHNLSYSEINTIKASVDLMRKRARNLNSLQRKKRKVN